VLYGYTVVSLFQNSYFHPVMNIDDDQTMV